MSMTTAIHDVTLDIGGMPIIVRTDSARFARLLADRYGEFVTVNTSRAVMELEIRLVEDGIRGTGHGTRDLAFVGEKPGLGIRDSEFGIRTPDSGHLASDSFKSISNSDLRTPDPGPRTPDLEDSEPAVSVRREGVRWIMERGDFHAEWDLTRNRGWVRQTVNPYSIDCVLRIIHSLILARTGGFLVHGAGVVRNGRAFIFAGVSGTGKTTIAQLAPPDVTLLTDEISYVRGQKPGAEEQGLGAEGWGLGLGTQESGVRSQQPGAGREELESKGQAESQIANRNSQIENPESLTPSPEFLTPDTRHLTPAFSAYGTPFAGELARIGVKVCAPLAGLYLLKQGPENRIEPVSEAQAVRELMRHILFFAHDRELVGMVFGTVCDFVKRVPVRRLVFTKDASVWDLIGQ